MTGSAMYTHVITDSVNEILHHARDTVTEMHWNLLISEPKA